MFKSIIVGENENPYPVRIIRGWNGKLELEADSKPSDKRTGRRGNKYNPHQSFREKNRRKLQLSIGMIKNYGT